jgi:hypothetical protein
MEPGRWCHVIYMDKRGVKLMYMSMAVALLVTTMLTVIGRREYFITWSHFYSALKISYYVPKPFLSKVK